MEVKNSENVFILEAVKLTAEVCYFNQHQDSNDVFQDSLEKTCFLSLEDMKNKINFFLNNTDRLDDLLIKQKNFEKNDLNYKTIEKIENFINK